MTDFNGYPYFVGETYACQWPVAHGLVGVHFEVGRCGRNGGHGDRLPVCWQHADALVDAAYDLIENYGHKLSPFPLTLMIEAINRAQPFGLDQVLVNRLDGMRCGTYRMDPNRVVADEFRSAVDRLLLDHVENHMKHRRSPALDEAIDRLIEERMQERWGMFA